MEYKKALIFGIFVFVIMAGVLISAHSDEDFASAEKIISQGTPCSELSNSQIEEIGDYYMEQIHPGETHEYMDNMMGGEGSESLKQFHITLAYRFYCNTENSYGYNTLGYGMMNSGYAPTQGMMGYNYYDRKSYNITNILLFAIIAVLIVAITIVSVKLGRKSNKKRRSRR